MFEHFIIMSSSYTKGVRIAFQHVCGGGVDQNEIEETMKIIKNVSDEGIAVSTHYICTDSK